MPKNRKLQNAIGVEHIKDEAENAIAQQAEGGATLAFKQVSVSGQNNIVADTSTDTLNIEAGANVTITTNASTDTITIAATDTNTDTNTFRTVTAGGNTLAGNETLAFTEGSNITISESAGAVTISAAGGSPGGSDGQMQYNNGGSFGGSSLTFTDTDGSEQFLFSDTSDTALVKIEQAGTGNAFEVHDKASDLTIFKIDNSGRAVIGNTPSDTSHSAFGLYVLSDTRLGRLRVGTGSNSEPGVHFEGDSNTGIRRTAEDQLGFITGGNERLSVGSAGEILIGGSAAGTSGQVLTSGGSGSAVTWAAASGGGGGGLPIPHIDIDNPPTFTNQASYNSYLSAYGISLTPGIPQTNSIAGGNFTSSQCYLWPFTWPADNHYIDSLKFRVYAASSTTGLESAFRMAFYKANENGWPTTRTGDQITITPTSTGSHYITHTFAAGSGIGPFNRGDLIWVGFGGPRAVNVGQTSGTIRFYGQGSNVYPIAGMNAGFTGVNPGFPYIFPLALALNSGGMTGFPSDLTDGSTWSTHIAGTGGSPSTRQIYPTSSTLSNSTYYPFINAKLRSTA